MSARIVRGLIVAVSVAILVGYVLAATMWYPYEPDPDWPYRDGAVYG